VQHCVHGRVGTVRGTTEVKPSPYDGGKVKIFQNLRPTQELNFRLRYILPKHKTLHHKEGYIIYRIHITYIVLLLYQLALMDVLIKIQQVTSHILPN